MQSQPYWPNPNPNPNSMSHDITLTLTLPCSQAESEEVTAKQAERFQGANPTANYNPEKPPLHPAALHYTEHLLLSMVR